MSNNIIFVDLNDIKVKLEKLREEFHQFYDPTCEYGQGYLDCLVEVAKELNKIISMVSYFSDKEKMILKQIVNEKRKFNNNDKNNIKQELEYIQEELDLMIFQQNQLQKRESELYRKLYIMEVLNFERKSGS